MTGPNTRATQLYINLADNVRLDAQGFAPIGRVIDGMDVVDRLYAGYGETAGGGMRGGRQGKILSGGNAYLDAAFPKLDRLLHAVLLGEARLRLDSARKSTALLAKGYASAPITVPRVSGSIQTQAPVKSAKKAASEMPPPRP
jgi:hypothetical protein